MQFNMIFVIATLALVVNAVPMDKGFEFGPLGWAYVRGKHQAACDHNKSNEVGCDNTDYCRWDGKCRYDEDAHKKAYVGAAANPPSQTTPTTSAVNANVVTTATTTTPVTTTTATTVAAAASPPKC